MNGTDIMFMYNFYTKEAQIMRKNIILMLLS